MSFEPIESYGVIGNMRTVALVSTKGSIDWFCFPHVDSPSVFAALLDDERGGRFSIRPRDPATRCKQLYWPDTNILVSRFLSEDGVAEIEDFMPAGIAHAPQWHDQLVRRLKCVRGCVGLELVCEPVFDYARVPARAELTPRGALFHGPGLDLALATALPLQLSKGKVTASFQLVEGQSVSLAFRGAPREGDCGRAPAEDEMSALFEATVSFWRRWLAGCTYRGRWREMVHRSALILKLLTFEPTGAIVAAPTCSLPEAVGGPRNWDYRYTWMRDAAFTVYALLRIGFREEAAAFMAWLEARCRETIWDRDRRPLQIVYRVDGSPDLDESVLGHLGGYRGSMPVRVGNGAARQLQLDIYGELMDAIYLFNKYGTPISYDLWQHVRRILDWVCDHWREPDEGIWEVRSGRQHFVYSKLMCWVALDRGLRLADKRSFPTPRERWTKERDALYESIMTEGFDQSRQAFVQAFGGDDLDASNLIMPLVFFVSPADPKMTSTIDAISASPSARGLLSDGLVYRYDTQVPRDGLLGREGTFNMCTFWLVEALTRSAGADRKKLEEARLLFERMLGYANHLGLYAEQTSASGEALGNYPQAFTHIALISAAFNLDRALSGQRAM
jgi:GH15 family glucan-1,4-alpha-glucosidase